MKTKALIISLMLLLLACFAPSAHAAGGVSFGVFYSSLGSYGEWISVSADVYAWRPMHVGVGWRPYTVGRWIWTDDGWYWASDEPWGWAAYHYGRWYYDDYYGWVWIPGYDWSPAWVEWRYGGDYIGWAPLGPYAVFHVGFGIQYSRHWVTPYNYWSFVDCHYVTTPGVHRYVYRTENNTRFIGRTRGAGSVGVDGGRVVTRGPDRGYIERRGNIRIPRGEIVDVNDRQQERVVRGARGERVEVYRPRIDDRGGRVEGERPGRVREAERSMSLDTRSLDVRSRDVAREEGRDLRRAGEVREPRAVERRPDDVPVTTPRRPGIDRSGDTRALEQRPDAVVPRTERRTERPSDPAVRSDERRMNEWSVPRTERRIEQMPDRRQQPIDRPPRVQREERSSSRPSEMRQERSRPSGGASRVESGSRGGERGGGRRGR